jgi:hypothetical protein
MYSFLYFDDGSHRYIDWCMGEDIPFLRIRSYNAVDTFPVERHDVVLTRTCPIYFIRLRKLFMRPRGSITTSSFRERLSEIAHGIQIIFQAHSEMRCEWKYRTSQLPYRGIRWWPRFGYADRLAWSVASSMSSSAASSQVSQAEQLHFRAAVWYCLETILPFMLAKLYERY